MSLRDFILGGQHLRLLQERILHSLIEAGRTTDFGRRHGFDRLRGPADYRQAVPLRDHDQCRQDIERIVAGEPGVLSHSPVYQFISSSGSSGGKPKVLPMTERFVKEAFAPFHRRSLESIQSRFPFVHPGDRCTLNLKADPLRPKPRLVNGREHVGLSQVQFCRDFEQMSAEPGADGPWVSIAPDMACELERLHAKLVASAGEQVRALIGINPRTVANVARLLALRADEVIEDVRTGCHRGVRIREARPDVARELSACAAASGSLAPGDLWPRLEAVIAWNEGAASAYQPHFKALFGPRVTCVEAPLGASEAPLTIPLYDGRPGGLLAYDTVFYEFLEVDGPHAGRVRMAHELEDGTCYCVIVSQQSGLYRYHLKDLVRVESHLHGVPRLSYQGRYVTGRALQENRLLDALRQAVSHAPIVAFTSTPSGAAGWRVWVEFRSDVPEECRAQACGDLGRRLAAVLAGGDRTTRDDEVEVIEVPPDTFHHAWQHELKAGRRAPQVKDLITVAGPPIFSSAGRAHCRIPVATPQSVRP